MRVVDIYCGGIFSKHTLDLVQGYKCEKPREGQTYYSVVNDPRD